MQLLHPVTASHLQDNSYNFFPMLIIAVIKINTLGEDILHLFSPMIC